MYSAIYGIIGVVKIREMSYCNTDFHWLFSKAVIQSNSFC